MREEQQMRQVAPAPVELFDLVGTLATLAAVDVLQVHPPARPIRALGLTLAITTLGYDTYHPEQGETYRVVHYFPVPPAAFDRRSWQRWLLEQFLAVERHEACEFFTIDGDKPYAPHHGPGNDPYIIFDHGTDEDVRTSFRGEVKEESA